MRFLKNANFARYCASTLFKYVIFARVYFCYAKKKKFLLAHTIACTRTRLNWDRSLHYGYLQAVPAYEETGLGEAATKASASVKKILKEWYNRMVKCYSKYESYICQMISLHLRVMDIPPVFAFII